MIGVLVGVALISAVVGAGVMVVLLRCRKIKILPSGRDTCPMLLRGTWTKGSTTSATGGGPTGTAPRVSEGTTKTGEEVPVAPTGGGTTHTGWSMKLWRRGSSQERPLRPTSSQGSENSYTEEPYVNADTQSAVYAELNSTTASAPGSASGGVSYRPYSLNTYSEIPDPLRPLSLAGGLRAYISESTYENAGYVLSEAGLEQPESSVGSTSTPSSAYYSDVSSSDTHNNKKKKKKKKNEERNNLNLQRSLMPSTISASVSMMNHHNILAAAADKRNSSGSRELPGQGLHPPLHNHELFPLALEILPQHLSLDNRGVEAVLPPLQPNMNIIHTANQVQTLPSIKNVNEVRAAINASQTIGGTVPSTAYPGGVPISGTSGGVPTGFSSGTPGALSGVTSGVIGVPSGPTVGIPGITPMHPGVASGISGSPGMPPGIPGLPSEIEGITAVPQGIPCGNAGGIPGLASGVPTGVPGFTVGVPVETLINNIEEEEEDEEEDQSHRPLPPLPSRQEQGPRRRGAYVSQSKQDQPLPPVPSEYV